MMRLIAILIISGVLFSFSLINTLQLLFKNETKSQIAKRHAAGMNQSTIAQKGETSAFLLSKMSDSAPLTREDFSKFNIAFDQSILPAPITPRRDEIDSLDKEKTALQQKVKLLENVVSYLKAQLNSLTHNDSRQTFPKFGWLLAGVTWLFGTIFTTAIQQFTVAAIQNNKHYSAWSKRSKRKQ